MALTFLFPHSRISTQLIKYVSYMLINLGTLLNNLLFFTYFRPTACKLIKNGGKSQNKFVNAHKQYWHSSTSIFLFLLINAGLAANGPARQTDWGEEPKGERKCGLLGNYLFYGGPSVQQLRFMFDNIKRGLRDYKLNSKRKYHEIGVQQTRQFTYTKFNITNFTDFLHQKSQILVPEQRQSCLPSPLPSHFDLNQPSWAGLQDAKGDKMWLTLEQLQPQEIQQ